MVYLIDKVAMKTTDAAKFRRWAAELRPETERLKTEGHREFIRRRVHDWVLYLSIKSVHVPTATELADTTDWMQRLLAEESTSLPVLTLLAESARTRKTRNLATSRRDRRDPH
ncbi:hypothetical protein [Actinomadura hallensis]|uniref:hypothetical protein n=1 Tax=Actinomadura hallensis TaxID=337895 RepID=UPI001C896107|nr:hypothetical protein [Actinomadura hallensis]